MFSCKLQGVTFVCLSEGNGGKPHDAWLRELFKEPLHSESSRLNGGAFKTSANCIMQDLGRYEVQAYLFDYPRALSYSVYIYIDSLYMAL